MLLPDVCTAVILVWTVLLLLKLFLFLFLLLHMIVCVCVYVVASKFLQIAGSTKLVPSPLPPPSAPATTGTADIATAVAAFLAETHTGLPNQSTAVMCSFRLRLRRSLYIIHNHFAPLRKLKHGCAFFSTMDLHSNSH